MQQPQSVTALELLKTEPKRLTTGCELLDRFLYGGISSGIFELVGEASSGKVQINHYYCFLKIGIFIYTHNLSWRIIQILYCFLKIEIYIFDFFSNTNELVQTQLVLQLLLTVQLPLEAGGLAGSALYICSEGKVSKNWVMKKNI